MVAAPEADGQARIGHHPGSEQTPSDSNAPRHLNVPVSAAANASDTYPLLQPRASVCAEPSVSRDSASGPGIYRNSVFTISAIALDFDGSQRGEGDLLPGGSGCERYFWAPPRCYSKYDCVSKILWRLELT